MGTSNNVFTWSTTPGSNTTADAGINWAEGQAPSTINDSARGMMAAVARWRSDHGALTTAGGTTAYTLTTNTGFTALATGLGFIAKINATNTGASTLAVDGLTAKAIRTPQDGALLAGDLLINQMYHFIYDAAANSAAGAWIVIALNKAPTRQRFTSGSGTYTTPTGARWLRLRMVGGGGAGGGCKATSASQHSVGSGGAGGGYVEHWIASPSSSYSYAVGAAGAAGAAGADGGNGGDTTFSTYAANGGTGGYSGNATTSLDALVGGVGGTTTGSPDIGRSGEIGGTGMAFINSAVILPGHGGSSPFGGGGRWGTPAASGAGVAAQGAGSGGSGAGNLQSQSARAGGAGTAGLIIVEEFY